MYDQNPDPSAAQPLVLPGCSCHIPRPGMSNRGCSIPQQRAPRTCKCLNEGARAAGAEPAPPALILLPRDTSNSKGIQARSANRAEKRDDLKMFNYQGKRWKLHLEIASESVVFPSNFRGAPLEEPGQRISPATTLQRPKKPFAQHQEPPAGTAMAA